MSIDLVFLEPVWLRCGFVVVRFGSRWFRNGSGRAAVVSPSRRCMAFWKNKITSRVLPSKNSASPTIFASLPSHILSCRTRVHRSNTSKTQAHQACEIVVSLSSALINARLFTEPHYHATRVSERTSSNFLTWHCQTCCLERWPPTLKYEARRLSASPTPFEKIERLSLTLVDPKFRCPCVGLSVRGRLAVATLATKPRLSDTDLAT